MGFIDSKIGLKIKGTPSFRKLSFNSHKKNKFKHRLEEKL